ncbi:MAG: sugar phosphate isomerase/epimerase, partial [Phycisphaerae bacterium]|nr:sugar phosphate isomerase/epimerase [Phycisphaerae bacterium]
EFLAGDEAIPEAWLDGVLVGSVTTEKYNLFDLACGKNSQRQEAIGFFRELLEFAGAYPINPDPTPAPPIVVVRAHVKSQPGNLQVQSYELAMNNLFFALEKLVETAEILGVTLAIENPAGGILQSPLELRDMLNELNNPFLGVCFNPLHAENLGSAKDWLEILGRHITAVRIAMVDNNREKTEARWQEILAEFRGNPIGGVVIIEE